MSSIYSFSTPISKQPASATPQTGGSSGGSSGGGSAKKAQGALKQIVGTYGRLLRKYDVSVANACATLESLLELYTVFISVYKTHSVVTKSNSAVKTVVNIVRNDDNGSRSVAVMRFNEHFPIVGEKLISSLLADIQNSERRFGDILDDLGDVFAAMTFICNDCYNLSLNETSRSICADDGSDIFSTSHIISVINIYAGVELQLSMLNGMKGGLGSGLINPIPSFSHNISSVSGFLDRLLSEERCKKLRDDVDIFYATNNIGEDA